MRKLMSMKIAVVAAGVAALMNSGALLQAADESHGTLTRKDYKFLRDAYLGNLLEVRLGELAKQKTTKPTVQQFAEQMVKDHSKAIDEMKKIATQKGATLPDRLSHSEESEYERLQKHSAIDFEKSYAEHMVKDHQNVFKEFQDAAKTAEDPDVKRFAQDSLPTLEHHQQMAQQMESSVKQQTP